MNILVLTAESLSDFSFVEKELNKCIPHKKDTTIFYRNLNKSDLLIAEYGRRKKIKLKEININVEKYGKASVYLETLRLIQMLDYIIAFDDGKSRDLAFSLKSARRLNKRVKIILFDNHKLRKQNGHKRDRK